MDQKAYVDELVRKSRAAQAQIAELSQEEVDRMVRGIGLRAYNEAGVCGKMALEETGKGRLETKITKQSKSVMWIWQYLKHAKSVGVVEDIPELALQKIAKPAGVVCCVLPVTNPTATPCGNAMHILKGRNSMIACPHPGAKKSSMYAVNAMRDELKKMGFPEDLIQAVEEPSLEINALLMSACNIVVATGGPGMVKAAYSSGRPSFGVGQGNAQTILAPDYTDFERFAMMTVGNRTYDNGMPCTTDQTLHVPKNRVAEVVAAFEKNDAYLIADPAEIQKMRETCFKDGLLNAKIVGQPAEKIAEMAGIKIPAGTRVLLCIVDKWGRDELLAKEIMCPFCRILPYEKYEDAVERVRTNYLMEGAGHTGAIYSNDDKYIALAADRVPVGRLCVNETPTFGGGCTLRNGLWPTNSLGCGFWGNNNISDNLNYKHLLNYTYIVKAIPGVVDPTPEEIWAE